MEGQHTAGANIRMWPHTAGVRQRGMDCRREEGTFGGDGGSLSDFGNGFMCVCKCLNLSNSTLQICVVYCKSIILGAGQKKKKPQ